MKILAVDDDRDLLSLIGFALRQGGFLALEASTGERALEVLEEEAPDLVVLDVNLPGIDGFEVCRRLRGRGDTTPVLMLTVRSEEDDVVQGLEIGADDYLTKPFSPRTLLARVRALLRRTAHETAKILERGDLRLDEEVRALRLGGAPPRRLTPLEFRLIQLLLAHEGRTVRSERILLHVWGREADGDRQLLKQLVHRLRQKIESDPSRPERLVTEPGVGYALRTVSPETD